jgi:hypothetical protein
MTIDEWEQLLIRELGKAGFDYEKPNLALAWEVFRRALHEEVEYDMGARVFGYREEGSGGGTSYRLYFGRLSEMDESYSWEVGLAFEVPADSSLRGQTFDVRQCPYDTSDLMSLDEFFDLAYAEPKLQTILAHVGEWKARIFREDHSD